MTGMKNSTLLEKILEYAKRINNSYNATMTAERFLLAVIDYVVGEFVIDVEDAYYEKTVDLLRDKIPDSPDFEQTRKDLMAHVKTNTEASNVEAAYFQQSTDKAKELANKAGREELSPEILLQYILNEPDEFLIKIIRKFSEPKTCLLQL